LGLFQDTVYPTTHREIHPGDTIMLFTDGLYEVEAENGEQFSQQMLFNAVQTHPGLDCGDLFDAILADIRKFSGSSQFADDVCLVGMQVSHKLK
ncbi:MAG: PP2C family protein-serine/threonine phosphatase, partial [Limisphaerales bacterium]